MYRNTGTNEKKIRTWLVAGLAVITVCGVAPQAWAVNDVISQWTFETSVPTTAGPFAPEAGSVTAPASAAATGLHAGASTYSNPAGNGLGAESFSSTNWAVNDYYQFKTSTTGLTNIGVQFDQVSSTTGPRDFKFQYSLNGTTFTDVGNYVLAPNNAPAWNSVAPVDPIGLDTFSFNLTSVAALNNAPSVFFRLLDNGTTSANGITTVPSTGTNRVDNFTVFNNFDSTQSPIAQPFATPVLPQANDVVMGSFSDRSKVTLPLVRGPAAGTGATPTPLSMWQSVPFIQSVKFDNTGGTNHNYKGNLLGVQFGNNNTANSGTIYSFATQGSTPAPAGQPIGNTTGTGGAGLTVSRLAGLSVSPSNNKVAVTGFDTGKVIVYDYNAGNTLGSGASLSGARESAATLAAAVTQGTTWLDNNTVLTLNSATGQLSKVDAGTMAVTNVGTPLGSPGIGTSSFTSLYYNPAVSQYVWAMTSAFTTTAETDVFALNASTFAIQDQAVYTTPPQAREIALDSSGNLFFSTNGTRVFVVQGADAAAQAANMPDDNAAVWYTQPLFLSGSNFNGLDVGLASTALAGDYNGDGFVNAADYTLWRDTLGSTTDLRANGDNTGPSAGVIDTADFTFWKNHFTSPGSGGGGLASGQVPEPASVVLAVLGVVGLGLARRRVAR